MCGRCIIFTYDEVLEIIQEIETHASINIMPDWPVRPINAYPKSVAPLITANFDTALGSRSSRDSTLLANELAWGFEQSWKPGLVFNTRIESAEKPMWRESIEHRRCILPVRSFFETHETETYESPKTGRLIKRPYEFKSPTNNIMLIGCIWKDGRFSMVTTDANADMAPVHHRMPLVVLQEELPLWFSGDYLSLADRSNIRLESEPTT